MKSQMVDIKTPDGTCDAYLSYPEGKNNLPLIIFYMDAIGLRPRLFEMVEHIAAQGYFVVAPNIFYRVHRSPIMDYDIFLKPESRPELLKKIRPMISELQSEMSKRDVLPILHFAKAHSEVNPLKVGAVGYCMGGGQALRAAGNYPNEFSAVATFHAGNLATEAKDSPSTVFPFIKAEVYIAHADQDASMPPDQIKKVSEMLDQSDAKYTTEIYSHCHHGWTMKDLPAYNKAGEERHWKELFSFFKRTLQN